MYFQLMHRQVRTGYALARIIALSGLMALTAGCEVELNRPLTLTTGNSTTASSTSSEEPAIAPEDIATPLSQWVTNGEVSAIQRSGLTLFLGGAFTQFGKFSGNFIPIDPLTGLRAAIYSETVAVRGIIRAVVRDGSGGLYIGGNFTKVGTTVRNCV